MIGRTQKLILGIALLILVDVIWVTSRELTLFFYENESYEKPFFCTYFKTSMFTIYLMLIGLLTPWKEACEKQNGNYAIMDQQTDDDSYFLSQATLGEPVFVPIRSSNGGTVVNGGIVSGTESDDSSVRSVRFSKLAEVREMSAHEATDALMARLSYSASMRMRRQKTHNKTAKTALVFCVLWLVANYFYHLAFEMGERTMITLISTSSTFFTLWLAAFFPSACGDKFTITKLIAVIFNIGGVVIMSLLNLRDTNLTRGVLLALFSAFFYASYLVFVKRKSDTEEKVDIPLFFGFVGLWNLLLMWPIFFILHFTKIEQFELPNQNQFAILFLNGFICTVLAQALWLWGCFLTSSLIGTIAVTFQIPLSIAFDMLLNKRTFSPMIYVGSIPMFSALIMVALLLRNDDSDPLMKIFKIIYRNICRCRKTNIVRINDDEQQESLISSGNND